MKKKAKTSSCKMNSSCFNGIYSLGMIGALVYNVSVATGFWMGVLGVLKALVWPAVLVYALMKSLGM